MRKISFWSCLILICTVSLTTSAQVGGDTSFRSVAIKGLTELYHKATDISSNLYNGARYEAHYPLFESNSHPFFKENNFYVGSVQLQGIVYENIPLIYDLVRDELILKHANAVSWQTLVQQKVDWFMLQGYKFIRLDEKNDIGLAEGFYNQLYAGNLSLLSKHEKTKRSIIEDRKILSAVSEKTIFYVVKGGKAFPVKNKKGLLTLLGDKRSALNQYIRQKRLNFKKEMEEALIQTITYYDQLTHS